MMDSSFPFEDAVEAAPLEDEATDSRKPVLVVGGLVASLVLGAGAFLFLGGGDDEGTDAVVPTRQPLAAAEESEPVAVEVVPVASSEQVGRNPFKVLYTEPKTSSGASTGSGTAPVTTPKIIEESKPAPPPPPAPAPAPAPVESDAGTTPTEPAPEPEPVVPADDGVRYPITLMTIPGEESLAVFWGFGEAGGFEVLPGEPFGRFKHLRVMQVVDSAERQGVMIQMGDGTPYFVAVGETVYVL